MIDRPDFLSYFQTATPIDQIDQLNIGSRPSHRRVTRTLDDLRAIPWVFAWIQSRANIPSWYGIGTAFSEWLGDDADGSRLKMLQTMNKDWPFFRTMLANVHVGIGRADMDIAGMYAKLADPAVGEAIFGDIKAEFELSREMLLKVTETKEILATEAVVKTQHQSAESLRGPDELHSGRVAQGDPQQPRPSGYRKVATIDRAVD